MLAAPLGFRSHHLIIVGIVNMTGTEPPTARRILWQWCLRLQSWAHQASSHSVFPCRHFRWHHCITLDVNTCAINGKIRLQAGNWFLEPNTSAGHSNFLDAFADVDASWKPAPIYISRAFTSKPDCNCWSWLPASFLRTQTRWICLGARYLC